MKKYREVMNLNTGKTSLVNEKEVSIDVNLLSKIFGETLIEKHIRK